MPRSGRSVALWVFPLILITPVVLGGIFGSKWLLRDEPDRSYACRGSDGGSATCFEGETVNMLIALGSAVWIAITLAVLVGLLRRWRRADALERRLQVSGLRAPGLVTEVSPTGTRINGRTVMRVVMQARIGDGSTVRCEVRTRDAPFEGTPVTLLYDPAAPNDVVVAEDLETLAASRWDARLDEVRGGA